MYESRILNYFKFPHVHKCLEVSWLFAFFSKWMCVTHRLERLFISMVSRQHQHHWVRYRTLYLWFDSWTTDLNVDSAPLSFISVVAVKVLAVTLVRELCHQMKSTLHVWIENFRRKNWNFSKIVNKSTKNFCYPFKTSELPPKCSIKVQLRLWKLTFCFSKF